MDVPFEYDHAEPLRVRRRPSHPPRPSTSRAVVILPVPVDRTTSYVGGTRNGPHEILQASSHMELWDDEMRADVHGVGIFTLPEMELPFGEMEPLHRRDRARRLRDHRPRQVPGVARRRALDHAAAGVGRRPQVPGPVGAADRRARRHARLLHGHPAQPRLRDAPVRCEHARADPGRHPQPLDRRGRDPAEAEHHGLLRRRRCARTRRGSTRSSSPSADDVYISDRRGRHGSGDHARHRHARARRALVAGNHHAAPQPSPNAAASSPPTSSS